MVLTPPRCEDLSSNERCFRVRQYQDGEFEVMFHRHVPIARMSRGSAISCIKSLVARFNAVSGLGFDEIVASHLNSRSGPDHRSGALEVQTELDTDSSTLRARCGGNTTAFFDEPVQSGNALSSRRVQ